MSVGSSRDVGPGGKSGLSSGGGGGEEMKCGSLSGTQALLRGGDKGDGGRERGVLAGDWEEGG